MALVIYTNGQIEIDKEWTKLHVRQDSDGTNLYIGEDSKFGYYRFSLQKKQYVLSYSKHPDWALFEDEVRKAYACMKQAEQIVKDLREDGSTDKEIEQYLCDGEALAKNGITNQTVVELVFSLV